MFSAGLRPELATALGREAWPGSPHPSSLDGWMTRQNRIGRCPQRLGGRPLAPGLDNGQEIRKALGTEDPDCHAPFQAALPQGQHALGRQGAPDAVPAGGSSGFPTDCIGDILCPRRESASLTVCPEG